ncbi:alpha/beta hydrolase family protein [Pseudonocardia cypriaca]|uniref:Acetyl esterase/lipase n=1 Tax=Pseudonocardia cypriaca TaxID=882449 RepID=A0A543FTN3_9PSEU|nr:alpha/beta hydrolase [Pseudonocardia cypriaca]TQM37104.1 acetyl esterase/lipase [Pseudonocardia cypriaca]
MSVIELTTFDVADDRTSDMLAARHAMIEAFRTDRRGFVAAKLIRLGERTWLDAVEWTDDAAYDESTAKGGNRPEIAAFFATIDALVEVSRGTRYDDAEDGPRAVRTVAYGPHPSQVGELYLPAGPGPFPGVVLFHGGFWAAMWDRRQILPVVVDLLSLGIAVYNVDYRRVGEDGGGWPGTFADVAAAVDTMAGIDPAVDAERIVLVGHSAGGHLATWAGLRAGLPAGAVGADPRVRPVGVVSLSGVLDLVAADGEKFGTDLADTDAEPIWGAPPPARPQVWPAVAAMVADGIVPLLLGAHADEDPERLAVTSPAQMRDGGVPVLAVHGDADEAVPAGYSRTFAESITAQGGRAEFVEYAGARHFDTVDPANPVIWPAVRTWITERIGTTPPPDAG